MTTAVLTWMMAASAKTRRRWLGAIFLACAAILLICGLTVLGGYLRGLALAAYWVVCLLFAVLAMGLALADFRAIGREARQEQQTLLQNAFGEFENKTSQKPGRPQGRTDG